MQELADWCGAGTAGANKTSVERDTPVAYLASLLASVPERAASVRLPALSAAAYIPQVRLLLLLDMCKDDQIGRI